MLFVLGPSYARSWGLLPFFALMALLKVKDVSTVLWLAEKWSQPEVVADDCLC